MRIYIILFCLFLLSATVTAQEHTAADSTYFYEQASQNLKSLKWGIAQLVDSKIEKISTIGLDYNYQKGSFRRAQQALRTNYFGFDADGISVLDRFKLYGYFSFNRTWLDSLAFSQKGIEDQYQPYYYYAGKPSVFERQTYLGGGIISYNIIKDKLYIGTGVDYLYNSSAGSVDPRSLTTTFNLKFSPQLSYKMGKSTFGFGVEIGYGDETIDIAYKNKDLDGSLTYPDRTSYLNYGYGHSRPSQSSFIRENSQTAVQMSYGIRFKNWDLQSRLAYSISKEDNQYPKDNSITNETFGIYQLETYKVNLLLNRKTDLATQQLEITFNIENGDDQFIELASRNFTYNSTNASLTYNHHYISSKNKPSLAWFTMLGYKQVYVRDAAVDHTIDYTYTYPRLGSTLYFNNPKGNLFSAQLAIGARLPIKNEISVPVTQEKYFTQGVVYHDHLYWASKVGEVQAQFDYITNKLIKNFKTGFALQSTYYRNLYTPSTTFNTRSVPGNSYIDLNLKINLYF